MSGPITTYRVYSYDGLTMELSGELVEAESDSEAIEQAQARGFGSKCEIWHGNRLVAQLDDERRQA